MLRRRLASHTSCLIGAPVDDVVNRTVMAVDLRTGDCSRIAGGIGWPQARRSASVRSVPSRRVL